MKNDTYFSRGSVLGNERISRFFKILLIMMLILENFIMFIPNQSAKAAEAYTSADFIIEGSVIKGFSESGLEKLKTNPDVVIGFSDSGITSIGDNAFYQVKGFKSVAIGGGITEIGSHAFQDTGLESVVLDGVKIVGDYAFANNNISQLSENSVLEFRDYSFKDNKLTTLNTNATLIGKDAFRNNELTKVQLNNVNTIGDNAFTSNNLVNVDGSVNVVMNSSQSDITLGQDIFTLNDSTNTGEKVYVKSNVDLVSNDTSSFLVNPVRIKLNLKDNATKELIKTVETEKVYEQNATSFVVNVPTVDGYIYSGTSKTETVTTLETDLFYDKVKGDPSISASPTKKLQFNVGQTINQAELLSNLVLQDSLGKTGSLSDVKTNVSSIDTSKEGTQTVVYTYTDLSGKSDTLELTYTIGLPSILDKEIKNGWVYGDFTYSGSVVTGLSVQGQQKLADGNTDIVIPDVNPYTRENITDTSVGGHWGLFTSIDYSTSPNLTTLRNVSLQDGKGGEMTLIFDNPKARVFEPGSYNNGTFENYNFVNGLSFQGLPNLTVTNSYAFAQSKFASLDFNGADSLQTISLATFEDSTISGVVDFTPLRNLTTIDYRAFQRSKAEGFIFGDLPKLKTIGNNAFAYTGITGELDLSKLPVLSSVGVSSFQHNSITSVNFPDSKSLVNIGISAFADNRITSVNFSDLTGLQHLQANVFTRNKISGELDLSPLTSLLTIVDAAFFGNEITGINFTGLSQLTYIGSTAFYNNKLTGALDLSPLKSLVTIGPSAFATGDDTINAKLEITSVDFTGLTKLTTIGNSAFSGQDITVLDLSPLESLTTIGGAAFKNNPITDLNLDNLTKLSVIDNDAFAANRVKVLDLTDLDSLKTIGATAFLNYTGKSAMTEVLLDNPDKLYTTNVGYGAFSNGIISETIELTESADKWLFETDSFRFNSERVNIHLKDSSYLPVKTPYTTLTAESTNRYNKVNYIIDNNDMNNDGVADIKTNTDYFYINKHKVTINYVDVDGNKISSTKVIDGYDGINYTPPTIYGYKYVSGSIPLSKVVDGVVQDETVTFVYEKDSTPIYTGDTSNIVFNLNNKTNKPSGVYSGQVVSMEIKLSISGSTANHTNRFIDVVLPEFVDTSTVNFDTSTNTGGLITGVTKISEYIYRINLADGVGGDDLTLPFTFKYLSHVTPQEYPGEVVANYIIDGTIASTSKQIQKYVYTGYTLNKVNTITNDYGTLLYKDGIEYLMLGTEKPIPYSFQITDVARDYNSVTYRMKLPTYQAYENGVVVTKTALLSDDMPNGWSLDGDTGYIIKTVSFDDSYLGIYSRNPFGNFYFVKSDTAYFEFPSAINQQTLDTTVTTSFDINNPQYSDSLPVKTIPLSQTINMVESPTGMFGKNNSGPGDSPRLTKYIVDNTSLNKEYQWSLLYKPDKVNVNGALVDPYSSTNVVLNDYALDSRMSYEAFRPNRDVTVSFYSQVNKLVDETARKSYTPVESSLLQTVTVKAGQRFEIPADIKSQIQYIKFDFGNNIFYGNEAANVQLYSKVKQTPYTYNVEHRNFMDGTADISAKDIITGEISTMSVKGNLYASKVLLNPQHRVEATKSITNLSTNSVLGVSKPVNYAIGYDMKDAQTNVPAGVLDYIGDKPLKDFVQVDIIPNTLTVDRVELTDTFKKLGATYTMELLSDGRTKITINSPYAPRGRLIVANVLTTIRDDARPSTINNETYIKYSNTDVTPLNTKAQTEFEGGKALSTANATFTFDRTLLMSGSKYIRTMDSGWTKQVYTEPGETFQYLLSLDNATTTTRTGTRIVDIFPYNNDATLVENQAGLRISRESDFNNTFKGIKSITKISSTGVRTDVTNSVPVKYITDITTLPDLDTSGTLDDWINTATLKNPSEVTDLSQVKGILVGDSSTTLNTMEKYEVVVDMVAPTKDLNNTSWKGEQGVNTFARYDDTAGRYLEVNAVKNILEVPKADFKLTKEDNSGKKLSGATFRLMNGDVVVAEAISNIDGDVFFRGIEYGDYQLVEYTAPSGYIKSNEVVNVKVDATTNTDTYLKTFINTPIPIPEPNVFYTLNLTKTDETGVILPNTEFNLIDNRTGAITPIIIDASGKATVNNLSSGYYTLKETKTVKNHTPIEDIVIQIDKTTTTNDVYNINVVNDKYNVLLTKIGLSSQLTKPETDLIPSDGTRLRNVVFDLYEKGNTTKVGTYTTDINGAILMKGLKSNMVYQLKEISTATGYAINPNPTEFKVGNDGKVYSVDNTPYTFGSLVVPNYKETYQGNMKIIKVDANTNTVLENAEFSLSKLDTTTNQYVEIDRVLTNSNGVAYFSNLESGLYQVKETKAPSGYAKSPDTYKFTVDERFNTNNYEYTFKNKPTELILRKVALIDENGANLSKYVDKYPSAFVQDGKVYANLTGAQFRLTDADGTVITPSSVSDSKGYTEYKYNNIDSNKDYTLEETIAPLGYDKALPMTIKGNVLTNANPTYTYYVENKKQLGDVVISKYARKTGVVLPGAEFGIFKVGEASPIQTVVTDAKGNAIFTDLELGNYIVKETKAPQGYKLSTDVYNVSLTTDHRLEVLTFLNDVAEKQYKIRKVDQLGTPLSGAEFQLIRDGKVISNATSDALGYIDFGIVPIDGTYQVAEVKAPNGYRVIAPQDIDINDDNKTIINYMATPKLPATGTNGLIPLGIATTVIGGMWLYVNRKKREFE